MNQVIETVGTGFETRPLASRADRGLVRIRNRVTRQDGTVVLEYTPLRMIKHRHPA